MTDPLTLGILTAAAALLGALLWAESRKQPHLILMTKTPLSLIFVLAAISQPHPDPTFFGVMMAGLILCLAGDVFLALPQKWAFMAGLVSFLLGHVAYVAAFFTLTTPGLWTLPGLGITLAVSAGVFLWLRPHLGKMLGPVVAYVVVITTMVVMASAVFADSEIPLTGRVMVLTGAILFYLSDLFVARNKFVQDGLVNRYIGLPLYYAGQFVLAFSIGQIG